MVYRGDYFNGGGSEIARFNSSGLGLGVTPTQLLDVSRAQNSPTLVRAFNGNVGSGAYVGFQAVADTGAGVFATFSSGSGNSNQTWLYTAGSHSLILGTAGQSRLQITGAGLLQDAAGNELGFKGVPTASVTSGAFVAADRGKRVKATAGVTIPNSTMSDTDVVHVLNTTGSAITITKSITTAYNKNTGTALGATFSLAARGSMTIEFTSGTECYVGGNIS